MFKGLLGGRKLEKKVFKTIEIYLSILIKSVECLHNLLITEDIKRSHCVDELERTADNIRREILSQIYEGAFLPYLRPNMFLLIDTVEKAFDLIKGCAFEFCYIIDFKIFTKETKEKCIEINFINAKMAKLLLEAFNELQNTDRLKEKILEIRHLEKKIDEIKLKIISLLRSRKISNFWEGETISNFVNYLSSISDVIEDASDQLIILDLSLP